MAKIPINNVFRKRWVKLASLAAAVIVLVSLLLVAFISTSAVQTWIISRITHRFSEEMKAHIFIRSVHISGLSSVSLSGIYVSDQHYDTLLYVPEMDVKIKFLSRKRHQLGLSEVSMENPVITIRRHAKDSLFNYQFLADYLKGDDKDTAAAARWIFSSEKFQFTDARLFYSDDHRAASSQGIDFNHLALNGLNLELLNFHYIRDTVTTRINQLSFSEKSGFSLEKMIARVMLTSHGVSLKDMLIRTGHSNIETDVSFSFENAGSFSNFIGEVRIYAFFLPSEVNMRDIAFFAPAATGMDNIVTIDGEVSGKINNLKLNDFRAEYGSFSRFFGNIRLTGLPMIEETFIQLSIKELKTNHYDLGSFRLPGGRALTIPPQIIELGNISIKGNFTGFYNDFVSYASFHTGIGSAFTDLSLKTETSTGRIEYSGKVQTREFNLGSLLRMQEYFGKVNLSATLTGSGLDPSEMILNIDGIIDSLYFKGNDFREIRLSGGILGKVISGSLTVNDKFLNLEFDGSIDLRKETPVFDFVSTIRDANLNALNLIRSDSVMKLSARLETRFAGLNPDQITGNAQLDSTVFTMNARSYHMKHMKVVISRTDSLEKEIHFTSDYADANALGSFSYTAILPALRQYLASYLPSLAGPGNQASSVPPQHFSLKVTLKDISELKGLGLPAALPAPGTTLIADFDETPGMLSLDAMSDTITWGGQQIIAWFLNGSAGTDSYWLNTGCRHFSFDEDKGLDSLSLSTVSRKDTIAFSLNWENDNPLVSNYGDIDGILSFLGPSHFRLHLDNSRTTINDSIWTIPHTNLVEIDSQIVKVNNLQFVSGDESISINGVLSKNPADVMQVDFDGFDLSNMDMLTGVQGFDFDGTLTGNARLRNLLDAPDISSDIMVRDFTVNKDKLGNAHIETSWNPLKKALEAKVEVVYRGNIGENRPILASGFYYPARKENSLDFTILIENFKLKTISHLLSSFSSRFTGLATGNLKLSGSLKHPEIEGNVRINRGLLKIDYLNTTYYFSDDLRISNHGFHLDQLTAYDTMGNKAIINGQITHQYFRNFRIDLDIKPDKVMVLNTTSHDNQFFFGNAYASGNASIQGPSDNLMMHIAARTEKGTQLTLPINTTMDVSNQDFISFTTAKADSVPRTDAVNELKGVTVNLNLDATPDASIRIFLPSDMGTIRANGQGDLKLLVDTRGQFSITGDYTIGEGSFLFTLQNVIYRMFHIQPGGKIMFTGDPYAATVNLRAIHNLDVPLTGLRIDPDQLQSISKKIPIQCIIDMKGSLFNPELNFKIATPEKDPEINRILFSQLDTNNQQQMSEQLIFLLVLKQFKPLERSNPLDLNASVGSSSWEMLSSQLNNWLSQISNDFDIGVNYKPGDRLTNDELTVALSTQLFDERVTVDGNLGYSGAKSPSATGQQATNLVGDVKVEVKLTEDGRFRVKAYNKSNNVSLFEDNAPYTQGLGIFFRKEFDHLMDLFKGKKKRQPGN